MSKNVFKIWEECSSCTSLSEALSEYSEKVKVKQQVLNYHLECSVCGKQERFADVCISIVDGHVIFLCKECGYIISKREHILSDLLNTFDEKERQTKITLYKKLIVLCDRVKVQ
jgi:transcription elongation factor Elf1